MPLPKRIQSLDILRGLIMVLMAIDHVRVYAGVPAGGPDPAIFFTRWVTHFCAPGFAFFAGAAAFLYGVKIDNKKQLARYLFTRGFLLVVLEFTVIRFGWTFNLDFSGFVLAGVIWMLGVCMILLGFLVRYDAKTVGIAGLAIIFFQRVFAYVPGILPEALRPYWEFIYSSGTDGPPWIAILYVIVPWVGVMAAGYGFGTILLMEEKRMRKYCHIIGLSCIAAFVIVGSILIMTSEASENAPPFLMRLLNQRKYPASPLYLMMTLGPLIALIPFAEKTRGAFSDFLTVFGRVPFFYYLAHIPVIHVSALIVNSILFGSLHQDWYGTAPFANVPPENMWNLGILYVVFAIDVALLYVVSRWYLGYKSGHPGKQWLKYV
ncbi:MAG TPA: heparan-alpha-glucosaminide N-acetyltransferase domain-containing protein [Cyclobacteriaceae bacterium]|nr:heparan-alpha-glucosaminide N-acetyltransferase domain-containing protein [Cyclobacteriaceae bacterium]